MNAMKKVIMLLIGAALVLSFAGAGAAVTISEDGSANVPVTTLNAQGDYVLKLPAGINVNYDGSFNKEAEYSLVLNEDAGFDEYKNLTVAITSNVKNNEGKFVLKNGENSVKYGVYMTTGSDYDDSWSNDATNYVDNENDNPFIDQVYTSVSGNICTVLMEELSSEFYFTEFTGSLTFTVTTNEE